MHPHQGDDRVAAAIASSTPPNPKHETVAAITKGVVSAIPLVGGVLSEVGNLFLNPLERRKQQWMQHVGEALGEINQRFGRVVSDLEKDERFISILYRTTESALKTHQEEKLTALRAALVSSVELSTTPDDTAFQFLRYIDELTPTHINLLALFSLTAKEGNQYGSLEQAYAAASTRTNNQVDRAIFRAFLQDLDSRFLVQIGDAKDFQEYASNTQYLTFESSKGRPLEITAFGLSFLKFVMR